VTRLRRSPFLIALDIDGTVAPIAPTPDAARVPEGTRNTLAKLASREGVYLAFVTGRGAADGERIVGVPHTFVIGNHGIELLDRDGVVHIDPQAQREAQRVAQASSRLATELAGIPGVFVEDKTWTLSVHYRLARRDDVPGVEALARAAAEAFQLRLTRGKEIFEIQPSVEVDKGTALLSLADALRVWSGGTLEGAILYAGDDRTDEDAFRALRARSREAITVHVGTARVNDILTAAEFTVGDPEEMRALLDWLADLR
jgi:trehalose-phosphatase